MYMRKRLSRTAWLVSVLSALSLLSPPARSQTTPNVTVEILGTGAESLLGGDLTDPENDGEDASGSATSPTWNWTEITSSHEPDFEGGEFSFNIFDNKVGGGNDKWCCDDPTIDIPVWVAVQFPQANSITHFTVTSGNDSPDRDPTDWAIQGSNDGISYTDIYHFTDTAVPWSERNQVVKFTLPGPSPAYRYVRYIAWETPGTLHQINEIEYFGIVGGANPVDTDKDGMPDEYETRMGFDPNDATDAAKDFDGDGVSNLDEYKAGTNPIDTTKPVLLATSTTGTFDTVTLTFSEELDPATATNTANYVISPSLAVTGATYKSKVVTLTTAKQTAGGTNYTVAITGVRDLSKNEVAAGTKGSFFSYLMTRNGVLKFSYWLSGPESQGTAVELLTSDPRYPNSPDLVGAVFSGSSRDFFPDDSHEQYGATLEGFLTPAESASYRFFVYSDDASQLYLSTDDTEANAVLIAEETGCCNNFTEPDSPRTSEPIALEANKKYFIRLIYKEGGGGDYGQVAWRKEGDTTPAGTLTPISGRFLSAAVDLPAPAEGGFTTQSPAPNAKNVSPTTPITIVHRDGLAPWTAANVSLKFNGASVTPTFTKDGNIATISYQPPGILASKSTNVITLTYPDPAGQPATREWSFETVVYAGPTKDVVNGYDGLLIGTAKHTADKGGATGKDGDYGIDLGLNATGGYVSATRPSFLDAATANDELTVAFWMKRYDIVNSSVFWVSSPSQARAFSAHAPWSDNNVYFDTGGTAAACCDGAANRISAPIDIMPGFVGDTSDISWWTNNWHFFVFSKKADVKQVYIDGTLFLEGNSTAVLSTNINLLYMGGEAGGIDRVHGIIDDFSFYSKALSQDQVTSLYNGTLPTALPAAAGLMAYWNFNDPPAATGDRPTVTVTRSGANISIQWSPAGGTLESSPTLGAGATWTPVGTANPASIAIGAGNLFYRIRQ